MKYMNNFPIFPLVCFAGVIILNVIELKMPNHLADQLKHTRGMAIDLPEEIRTLKSKPEPLEGFIRNDTIFIQFPDK